MFYDNLINYLDLVLIVVIPLIIVALAGMFSERSGVVNIALEGIMIFGAFIGILFVNGKFYPHFPEVQAILDGGGVTAFQRAMTLQAEMFVDMLGPLTTYLLGMLVAAISGAAISYFHAVAAIKMQANQIISATAINTLTPALALFLTMSLGLGESQGTDKLPIHGSVFKIQEIPLLSKIPFIGDVFFTDVFPSLYLGIIVLIVSYIVLYKTKFGLRLRSCGENPHAADAACINIYKMRYAGVLISGVLAGIGGYFFVLGYTLEFDATVAGYGFLAIAVLIFGNWKPFNIALAAMLFAALLTLSKGIAFFPALEALNIDGSILSMLPYIATIIVLALTSKNSAAPKAEGQIYDKGER